ncbi:hypothetical protein FOZ62_026923, partial [Perkinsus olseni]
VIESQVWKDSVTASRERARARMRTDCRHALLEMLSAKFYMGDRVCQGSNTPCYCTTTPPPTPTPSGGPCPDGDAYCRQQTGDTGSYCKAAYQRGPGGGVCQGFDVPCTCSIPAPTVAPASTVQPAPTM